jgi:hypothetical protein
MSSNSSTMYLAEAMRKLIYSKLRMNLRLLTNSIIVLVLNYHTIELTFNNIKILELAVIQSKLTHFVCRIM